MQIIADYWKEILAGVLGIYEVIVRIFPTVSSKSFIRLIVNLLKWLSDNLDNIKK